MNLKTLALLTMSLLMVAGAGVSGALPAAQMEDTPLLMLMEGNLWIWEEMPARFDQLTDNGYNRRLALSPDGSRVAYTAIAEIALPAVEGGAALGDAPLPVDVWVLDLDSEQKVQVGSQPADAAFAGDGTPGSYIARSAPAWSPDGTKLAWVEHNPTDGAYRLVAYDLASSSATTIVPTLPEQAGVPALADPRWGSPGIAVYLVVMNASSGLFEDAFLIYDGNGALRADARHKSGDGGSVADTMWVTSGAQDMLGVVLSSGGGLLVDPATGEMQSTTQTFEQYSLANPTESAVLYFKPKFDQQAGLSFSWWYAASDGQTWELPYTGDTRHLALSASSQTVAYVGDEGIYIWRGGQSGKIAGTETAGGDPWAGVMWGATAWRLPEGQAAAQAGTPTSGSAEPLTPEAAPTQAPAPTQDSTYNCPGSPAPRLVVGQKGRVTPGTPNRMRRDPGGRYMRDIPGGATFDVLEGPVCADNTTWWKVRYGSSEGWTVEGQGQSYWLEPAP